MLVDPPMDPGIQPPQSKHLLESNPLKSAEPPAAAMASRTLGTIYSLKDLSNLQTEIRQSTEASDAAVGVLAARHARDGAAERGPRTTPHIHMHIHIHVHIHIHIHIHVHVPIHIHIHVLILMHGHGQLAYCESGSQRVRPEQILNFEGVNPRSRGSFPEIQSQRFSVSGFLVCRLPMIFKPPPTPEGKAQAREPPPSSRFESHGAAGRDSPRSAAPCLLARLLFINCFTETS